MEFVFHALPTQPIRDRSAGRWHSRVRRAAGVAGALAVLLQVASCGHATLPIAEAASIGALVSERPLALLFSTRGCRYCDIAERGFADAARLLGAFAHVRKIMVHPDNVRGLRSRFDLKGTPDARLVLANGHWEKLPLTREGAVVAKAVRAIVAAPAHPRARIDP